MKRKDAMLTPEESRLYEQYCTNQVQAMVQCPPIQSTDSILKEVEKVLAPEKK